MSGERPDLDSEPAVRLGDDLACRDCDVRAFVLDCPANIGAPALRDRADQIAAHSHFDRSATHVGHMQRRADPHLGILAGNLAARLERGLHLRLTFFNALRSPGRVRTGDKWDALRDVKRKRCTVALERIEKTHVSSVASGELSQAAFQHLANGGVR